MADFGKSQGPSEEWETFVRENPPPAADPGLSVIELRAARNALRISTSQSEIEAEALMTKASWKDYSVLTRDKQNIIVRVYRPSHVPEATTPLPVYLYFHGGGHLFGTVETEDATCMRIAAAAVMVVVNVGYRHTPEYTHPTQFNDAWDSLEWLAGNGESIGGDVSRVVVGGVSAGAALAASIALRHHSPLRDGRCVAPNVTIRGQLLGVPWLMHMDNLDPARDPSGSLAQNANAPVLPHSLLRLFTDLLDAQDPEDPLLNIAVSDDSAVVGLPRSSFLVAGQDPFRDEGLIYAQKLERMGVPTKVHVFAGLPHSFRSYTHLPSSKRWDKLVFESLGWFIAD